jgi:hypothetical protein
MTMGHSGPSSVEQGEAEGMMMGPPLKTLSVVALSGRKTMKSSGSNTMTATDSEQTLKLIVIACRTCWG